ncbi:hypothetical protein LCGC14_0946710 [marine sediment metagenome]|uniref:Uncharacterized protein n=1 Tax=marine sediment metagenome TaxID=412755 RepID=A0A0F9R226_9ZZZZ
MTEFEIEFRRKHKEDIEVYEQIYLNQEGCCSICGEWSPIYWLHMRTPKRPGAAPELRCCRCFRSLELAGGVLKNKRER